MENWTRNEKIGLLSLLAAIVSALAAVAVVPEVRQRFMSGADSSHPATLAAMIFPRGNPTRVEIDENQLRQLCEKRLQSTDLAGMTQRELELLRNGIFALHGRPFARGDLREIFTRQPWYRSDPTYDDGRLTKIDAYNIDVILKAERSTRTNGGA